MSTLTKLPNEITVSGDLRFFKQTATKVTLENAQYGSKVGADGFTQTWVNGYSTETGLFWLIVLTECGRVKARATGLGLVAVA